MARWLNTKIYLDIHIFLSASTVGTSLIYVKTRLPSEKAPTFLTQFADQCDGQFINRYNSTAFLASLGACTAVLELEESLKRASVISELIFSIRKISLAVV